VSGRKVAHCSSLQNENIERQKLCGQREREREREVVWPEREKWCGQRDRSGCGQRYRSGVAIETEVLFPEILVIQ